MVGGLVRCSSVLTLFPCFTHVLVSDDVERWIHPDHEFYVSPRTQLFRQEHSQMQIRLDRRLLSASRNTTFS